jgi:hypothetical protein
MKSWISNSIVSTKICPRTVEFSPLLAKFDRLLVEAVAEQEVLIR